MVKMRKLYINKKGILFTIGLMFLALVVLALAVLIFHNTQEHEEIVAKLAVLDRVYDLSTSIEESLIDIFYIKSGISVSIVGNDVEFEETLANPNPNMGALSTSLNDFETFVESEFPDISVNVQNVVEMPLKIMPDLADPTEYVVYKHATNWADVVVEPVGVDIDDYIDGYTVDITISSSENLNCGDSPTPGGSLGLDISLTVDNIGLGGGCSVSVIDVLPTTTLTVTDSQPQPNTVLVVELGASNVFTVNPAESIVVSAKTTVHMNQPPDGIIADSLYFDIDFGEFGVTKSSTVRII